LKNQKKIHTTPKCNTQKKVTLRPWFWVRKIFCEKSHERLFWALFAVHTGKKKDLVKKCEICEFTRIRVKKFEFGSTVSICM
jgi:hypothetical protein